MPTFNAEKLIAELQQESKQTELDLSHNFLRDEKAILPTHEFKFLARSDDIVIALAVFPDGRFVSGSSQGSIKLWDAQGNCLKTLTGHEYVSALAVLPDGRFISATGTYSDTSIKLWDDQGNCLKTLKAGFFRLNEGHAETVYALAVLPDGRFLSGSADNSIKLWDTTGRCLMTLKEHTRSVVALAVLPDGHFISASDDKTIKLWDDQGNCLDTLMGHNRTWATSLAVLPDGRFLSGSWDKSIKLWDTKCNCLNTLTGHSGKVKALAVLPDGHFISASDDKTIKLWDDQGNCLKTLTGHSEVISVAVLPDSRFISSSVDKSLKLWQEQLIPRPLCLNDIAPVLTALAQQKHIQKLNLQNTKLGDNDVSVLLKALQAAVGLKQVDVRETSISATGVKVLHQGLPALEILHPAIAEILKLEQLVLLEKQQREQAERERQEKEALEQKLTAQRKAEESARAQEAEKTKLKTTYVDPLQKHVIALQAEKITELDLSQEKIFDETVQGYLRSLALKDLAIFLEALQANRSLKKLNLRQTVLGNEAIMTLAVVLNDNTTLAELDLTQTGISKQGIKELQQELKARKGFLKLRHESSLVALTLGSAAVEEKSPEVKQASSPVKNLQREEKKVDISVSYLIPFDELALDKELGQGGFGIVYQATWRYNPVAVKQLLNQKLSNDLLEEFKNETQLMARLRSPNIVQFFGYCENPKYCLVMEYMPKGSLFNVLHSKETLHWDIRYKIITDIACGLAFLHHENILHRDIKSLNVLLDEHYHAKLTDFGLSKIKKEIQSTSTKGASVGTVAWMPPELFQRKGKFTKKSDVYSMGYTFWEVAARKVPFSDAENAAVIPTWISQGERDDMPQDCPKKLSTLIKFCWQGDPDKRPDATSVVKYLKSQSEDFATFDPQASDSNNAQTEVKASSNQIATSAQNSSSSTPHYRSNLLSEQTAPSLRK